MRHGPVQYARCESGSWVVRRFDSTVVLLRRASEERLNGDTVRELLFCCAELDLIRVHVGATRDSRRLDVVGQVNGLESGYGGKTGGR